MQRDNNENYRGQLSITSIVNIYPTDIKQIDTWFVAYSPSFNIYDTAPRRAQIQFIYKVAGRENSTRGVFGTRVTPQRERKYNSTNYACHRKPLSAARIYEIVSPPSLQKYIATRKIQLAAPPLIQGERIRQLLGFGLGIESQGKRKEKERQRKTILPHEIVFALRVFVPVQVYSNHKVIHQKAPELFLQKYIKFYFFQSLNNFLTPK